MSEELDLDLCKGGGPLPSEERRRRGGILKGGNSRGLLNFFRIVESGEDVTDDKLPVESTLRSTIGGIASDFFFIRNKRNSLELTNNSFEEKVKSMNGGEEGAAEVGDTIGSDMNG